jgi:hypothetical protein
MTGDFVARLVARTLGTCAAVRPRPLSRYEASRPVIGTPGPAEPPTGDVPLFEGAPSAVDLRPLVRPPGQRLGTPPRREGGKRPQMSYPPIRSAAALPVPDDVRLSTGGPSPTVTEEPSRPPVAGPRLVPAADGAAIPDSGQAPGAPVDAPSLRPSPWTRPHEPVVRTTSALRYIGQDEGDAEAGTRVQEARSDSVSGQGQVAMADVVFVDPPARPVEHGVGPVPPSRRPVPGSLSPPTVHVTVGTIEVRAAIEPTQRSQSPQPESPPTSLHAYLRGDRGDP